MKLPHPSGYFLLLLHKDSIPSLQMKVVKNPKLHNLKDFY